MASTIATPTGLQNPYDWYTRVPNYVQLMVQTLASSANTVPVPAGAQFVRLQGNGDLYVSWTSTAVSTVGTSGASTATSSGSEFVGYQSGGVLRMVNGNTTAFGIMSTQAAISYSLSWWTI